MSSNDEWRASFQSVHCPFYGPPCPLCSSPALSWHKTKRACSSHHRGPVSKVKKKASFRRLAHFSRILPRAEKEGLRTLCGLFAGTSAFICVAESEQNLAKDASDTKRRFKFTMGFSVIKFAQVGFYNAPVRLEFYLSTLSPSLKTIRAAESADPAVSSAKRGSADPYGFFS